MNKAKAERDPVEVLASEFMERQRRGENPSVDEYAQAHPHLADEIRDLFPTIAAAEEMKIRREGVEGGRASLGPTKLERLGDFRIVREIGRGGMGIVYEAVQESLDRRVAIKVLPRQSLLNEQGLKRFQREAHLAASLHHTNIAEVFGAGEQEGYHYYVMQYIEGVGLDAVIERLGRTADPSNAQPGKPRLSGSISVDEVFKKIRFDGRAAHWRNVAKIGLQVASALSYAHSQGTLHRDIKPANLLIGTDGNVWITDFGLAKALSSESLTMSGEIAGTLLYMSPEQLQGEAGSRSDIYSLGVTLYELLTRQSAFQAGTQAGLLYKVSQGLTTTPRSVDATIPRDLETIVLKATAADPHQRYASATDLADDLQRFLDDLPLRARRASAAEKFWRWCRRNKAIASLGAATFVLTFLVAIVASIGLASTQKALRGAEENERTAQANAKRAEANAALAMEALDRIFERFSPSPVGVPSQLTVEDSEGATFSVPNAPVLSKGAALLLDDLMAFYDRLAQQEPSRADWQHKVADANRRVGDIRRVLGEFERAESSYQKALAVYPLSGDARPGLQTALETSRIHNARGQCFLAARAKEDAQQAHEQALKILASATETSDEVRYETARTHLFLGTPPRPDPGTSQRRPKRFGDEKANGKQHFLRHGDGPPIKPPDPVKQAYAQKHLAQAIERIRELVEAQPDNPEYRHLLSACYRERYVLESTVDPKMAKASFREATTILEQLVDDFPNVPRYQHDLCYTYADENVHGGFKGPSGAEELSKRFAKAKELADQLVERHPSVPQYAATRAKVAHKLSVVLERQGKWAEAEKAARLAVDTQEALARQFPDVAQHKAWLGVFSCELAFSLLAQHKASDARPLLTRTLSLLEEVVKEDPDSESLQFVLRRCKIMHERSSQRRGPGPGMGGPGRRGPFAPPRPGDDGKRRPPPRLEERDK